MNSVNELLSALVSPKFWRGLPHYIGFSKQKEKFSIVDASSMEQFISSRANHISQISLYGYMRTRVGTRYPELFENSDILVSINIAKWHIWLACVSDLCVFFGQIIFRSERLSSTETGLLVSSVINRLLQQAEYTADAGPDFESAIEKSRQRIRTCDWSIERDDDTIFSQSPEALYHWSPIADELKIRDENIVRNSIRFRWIEVRRSARQLIDIDLIVQNEQGALQAESVEAL